MDAKIKPFFLPVILIIFEAAIMKIAVPTIDNDMGKVDNDLIGLMLDPIIPLKKTVTGAAVKLKIWLNVKIKRFLFIGHINLFGLYNH